MAKRKQKGLYKQPGHIWPHKFITNKGNEVTIVKTVSTGDELNDVKNTILVNDKAVKGTYDYKQIESMRK